ncbi:T6SS amidase immunity protein Tai4 family protein [Caldimonas brevitalea]|uniref:Uncharacterized protein n=1 Tax=Caldimonas brevitalea TaxID=413882 RepID=A0A0G3BRB3_9BURK|nr:T6SS amidase immunity protein Tai4 family protein [Caldimonas brevitalea]AKJ31964.1 hypothetical protein AAW51_5273 [Caldimonas brevitalea]
MKSALIAVSLVLLTLGHLARADESDRAQYSRSMTETYNQKTLLKNWALSVCLAKISKDPAAKADANATASAYLEFGQQPIEAYDALRDLADRYANRKYGGAVESEFNTMKCIDLFHSKELDQLASKLAKNGRKPTAP